MPLTEQQRRNLRAQWKQVGEEFIRADMLNNGGMRDVGGTLEVREECRAWLTEQQTERETARKALEDADRAAGAASDARNYKIQWWSAVFSGISAATGVIPLVGAFAAGALFTWLLMKLFG